MGYTIADFNHDGKLDFFISGIENLTDFSSPIGTEGNGLYLGGNGRTFNYSSDVVSSL